MKIAFPADRPSPEANVDIRFGRAHCFAVYDDQSGEYSFAPNLQNLSLPQGAGIQAAKNVIEAGANSLVARNVGPKAFDLLRRSGVEMYVCDENTRVMEALDLHRNGCLTKLDDANAEGHW